MNPTRDNAQPWEPGADTAARSALAGGLHDDSTTPAANRQTAGAVRADFTGPAIWRAPDADHPIVVVGCAGEKDGATFMRIEGSAAGIPLADIVLPDPDLPRSTPTTAPAQMTMLQVARFYHALGLNVIPTASDKRPVEVGTGRLAWGQWKGTRQTLTDLERLPWARAAGLAAICGPVSASLVCPDFDPYKDGDLGVVNPSMRLVQEFLAALSLPADYGWLVRSGSGRGYHAWVLCPGLVLPADGEKGRVDRPARADFNHIELRYTGHYALLPGGGAYAFVAGDWPEEAPATVTPEALLAAYDAVTVAGAPKAARTAKTGAATTATRAQTVTPDQYTAYAKTALDRELATLAAAQPGNRNNTLNQCGLKLAELAKANVLNWQDVSTRLTLTAQGAGLTDQEIAATLASAYKGASARALPAPAAAASSASPEHEPGAPGSNGTDPATQEPPRRFPLTDLGNAERLVSRAGHDLRYVQEWGRWLVWTGKRWEPDRAGLVKRRAKATVRQIYTEAASVADDDARKEIAKWAMRSEARQRIDALIDLAQSEKDVAVLPEALDLDPWLLNCENGTIDLRAGTLRPHERGALITKLAPAVYDPDAACPTWLAFLDTIMAGNQDLIDFLQRAVGYSLTGLVSEQVLFFAYGKGGNGKSTFVETLTALLGDYAQKAPKGFLTVKPNGADGVPNDVARLPGARFVVSNEVDEGRRLAEALVKDLTGGDTLTARFMRGEFFQFAPSHKLWIYGNHRPVVKGTDEGIWRRIRLVPFTVSISEDKKDRNLSDKLRAELPGILAWAVQGCLDWQRDGLGTPAEVKAATEAYRAEMDVIAEFLAESCVMTPNAETAKAALYTAYQAWCESSGERALTKIAFGRRLKERGIAEGTNAAGSARVWLGVGLLATQEGGRLTSLTTSDSFSGISTKKSTRVDVILENPSDLSDLSDAADWEEGEL